MHFCCLSYPVCDTSYVSPNKPKQWAPVKVLCVRASGLCSAGNSFSAWLSVGPVATSQAITIVFTCLLVEENAILFLFWRHLGWCGLNTQTLYSKRTSPYLRNQSTGVKYQVTQSWGLAGLVDHIDIGFHADTVSQEHLLST